MKKTLWTGLSIFVIGLIFLMIGLIKNDFSFNNIERNVIRTENQHYGNQYTKNFKKVNGIVIKANAAVTVKHNTNNRFQIVGSNGVNKNINYQLHNGKLIITQSGHFQNHFHFNLMNNGIYHNAKIKILIPKDQKLTSFQQNNSLSTLHIDGITFKKSIQLSNVGDFYLENVNANSLNANSSDGDGGIHRCRFMKQRSSLDTASGDIYIVNSNFKALKATSSDGDIAAKNNVVTSGKTLVHSDDGDISLGINKWNQLHLTSEDGDIAFRHQNIKNNFYAYTSDGDIRGHVNPNDNAKIITRTADGSKHLKKNLSKDNSNKIYHFGSSDGDIVII